MIAIMTCSEKDTRSVDADPGLPSAEVAGVAEHLQG